MSDHQSLDERYFTWLYSKVGSVKNRNPARSRWLLCEQLYKTPFNDSTPHDYNRSLDGIELRQEFLDDTGTYYDHEWMQLDCSILEMLLGLARRVSFQNGVGLYDWFWEALRNLEIDKYTDDEYDDSIVLLVDEVLERVNNREYEPSGHGGLFPLNHPKKDQREVELWYQMHAYLLEHMTL